MKNVPIKFRGRDIIGGAYVYGDYVTRSEGCAIRVCEWDRLFNTHKYEITVKPDSVSQLVGYDINGEEVYEGDKIYDTENPADTVIAELYPCVTLQFYKLNGGLIMTLPLPVKKNKFGQRVADIPVTDYYGQIMEEVLEAHKASVIFDVKKHLVNEGCGQCAEFIQTNEAEELVDVITCCVTRLDITCVFVYEDKEEKAPLEHIIAELPPLEVPKDFYRELEKKILYAHRAATKYDVATIDYEGFTYSELEELNHSEGYALVEIIQLCIARLENHGYDKSARQKLYAAVNEKNRKRGYFED